MGDQVRSINVDRSIMLPPRLRRGRGRPSFSEEQLLSPIPAVLGEEGDEA